MAYQYQYIARTSDAIPALDPETRGVPMRSRIPVPALSRAIALAQSVREAENRAATRYSAEARATRGAHV